MRANFLLTAMLIFFLSLSMSGQDGKDPQVLEKNPPELEKDPQVLEKGPLLLEKAPLVLGEKFVLKSEVLGQDRDILISLPRGYEAGEASYPVHVILDAEITFEAYAGVVHLMHMADQIPDAIVVGIPNIDRSYDLDFLRNGANFLTFLTRELLPEMDRSYRTTEDRLIAGYSVAGNYVMYAFFEGSGFFNRFLSGSPYGLYLFYNTHLYNLPDALPEPRRVYTSMGSDDLEDQLGPFKEFCAVLDSLSIEGFDFRYDVLEKQDHNSNILPNWHQGLAYLYKDWSPKP
jgi:predicted alpha/beta superfamily hydrolase